MAFMQGLGLLLLAPMILSFFAGGAVLAHALASSGAVSPWNLRLHGIALLIAVAGRMLASSGLVPARAVGLAVLACVAGAQMWSGAAIAQLPRPRAAAVAAIR